MVPAPPPKPQSSFEQWLRAAHSSPWFEVIERQDSTGWRSARKPFTTQGLIQHFSGQSFVTGIRPEKLVRYGVVDIDNKEDHASCYWHEFAKSPELIELGRRVEEIGCRVSFLRSSHSGGLHAFVTFPEAIHAWLSHWLMRWLLEASGMAVKAGQAEVFPSRIDYRTDGQRARSHGFRLPGQKGSALIVAESLYEEAETIYTQLLNDLDDTEYCEQWLAGLEAAKKLKFSQAGRESFSRKKSVTPSTGIEWTKSGKSSEILAAITTQARLANRNIKCPIQLGKIIREVAINAKGFNEFASEETKRDLMHENGGWAERWARSSLKKEFCGIPPSQASDNDRNDRLFRESRAKIKKFAERFPEAASWSKRKLAEVIGMTRRTLEKHWDYWVSVLVPTPPNNGVADPGPTEPAIQGEIRTKQQGPLSKLGQAMDALWNLFTDEEIEEADFGVRNAPFSLSYDRSRPKQSLPMDFCT